MKRITFYLGVCLIFVGLLGCSGSSNKDNPVSQTVYKNTPTLQQAETLLKRYVFQKKPDYNPQAEFAFKDITPSQIRNQLNAHIYQAVGEAEHGQVYIIKDGIVNELGAAWGSEGLDSMCLADLNSDGTPELIYSYTLGSGIPRGLIEAYLGPNQILKSDASFKFGMWYLMRINDHNVSVKDGRNGAIIGKLRLKAKNNLEVVLSDNIPGEVSARIEVDAKKQTATNEIQKISSEEADRIISNIVGDLPKNYHVTYENTQTVDGRVYYVYHGFEVVIDDPEKGESHTATFGWYYVDSISGKAFQMDIAEGKLRPMEGSEH